MDKNKVEKIKQAIKNSGLTQREIAEIMNIQETQLSRWVQGKTTPGTRSLRDFQKALNLPNNYFFENSGNIAAENSAISVTNPTDNARLALLEKDVEILKKDIEILKLKINKE